MDGETKILAKISQSKVPLPGADESAFPTGDVRYKEAFPTDTSLDAGQDRKNIDKTFAMPHKASPRVILLVVEDALNTGGMDQGDDLLVGDTVKDSDKSADKGGDSTDDMYNVLGTLGARNILASGGLRSVFTTASLSVATTSTVVSPAVAIASGSFPTVQEGKWKITEPEQPKQAERDYEIAKIHAERELEMMIAELDRSNEIIVKYLSEYEQAKAGLSHDEKVELIDELLMYQRNLAEIKKYQA
nr:hypothetical protein [Tanacetum cinerariifolium]